MFLVPLLSVFLSGGWSGISHSEKNFCEGGTSIMSQTVSGRRSLSGPTLMFLQAGNLLSLMSVTQRLIYTQHHYYSLPIDSFLAVSSARQF